MTLTWRLPATTVPPSDCSTLREAVPSSVNAIVAATKQAHPEVEKTAGDMVVPFATLAESIDLYRTTFANRGLDYAIWGHVSDGNLHPNVVPHSFDDVRRGREAILEMARGVVAHGWRTACRTRRRQKRAEAATACASCIGPEGIDQMRAVKRALDPEWKLSPGVLFDP